MRYHVIYVDGQAEIHSPTCDEYDESAVEGSEMVESANPYGAAVEAWTHEKQPYPDELAVHGTLFFPCLSARQSAAARARLPFDIEEDENADILAYVKGRTIEWLNGFNGKKERATVPRDGTFEIDGRAKPGVYNEHLTLADTSTGRRVLTFVDYKGTGFRSVALDTIVRIR